jgi:hypothetical protein
MAFCGMKWLYAKRKVRQGLFEFCGTRKAGLLAEFADATVESLNHAVRLGMAGGMRRWSIWVRAQAWSKA